MVVQPIGADEKQMFCKKSAAVDSLQIVVIAYDDQGGGALVRLCRQRPWRQCRRHAATRSLLERAADPNYPKT